MPRWWILCFTTVAIGIALTVAVLVDPRFSFAFHAPVARAVLETAVTIVGSLVAFLVVGRYRRRRQSEDLAIAVALLVLALNYPLFIALPSLHPGRLSDGGAWAYLIVHGCAAGLLCWASTQALRRRSDPAPALHGHLSSDPWIETRERNEDQAPHPLTLIYGVSATALVCLVLLSYFGFDPDATHATPPTAMRLFGQPGTSAVRLLSFALFVTAALFFAWRNRWRTDRLIGWLSVGCALLAIGDLQYGLYPPLMAGELHLGDAFRLAAVLVFAVGGAEEIHSYWYESRQVARLEDRRLVAADIHDGIAQELAFLSAHVRETRGIPDGQWLEQLRAATDRALAESRRAIAALIADRPLTLSGDIGNTVLEITAGAPVQAEIDVHSTWVDRLDREALVRIIREAVRNAVRHGDPTSIRVELHGHPHPILRIIDDGMGFDMSSVDRSGRFGMTIMQERARSIGARFSVHSAPTRGTTVEVSWAPEPRRDARPTSASAIENSLTRIHTGLARTNGVRKIKR